MNRRTYLFTSESVTEGHPDKVCDTIADSILDACLAQDIHSRVACETLAKSDLVVLAGEITSSAKLDYEEIVRTAIREIGYTKDISAAFNENCKILSALTRQSPDIAQGVDARAAEGKTTAEQGAGDQGLMFGFACNETPELMPAPIMFAHNLGKSLREARRSRRIPWLRPDGKTQVTIEYDGLQPVRITTIVVSNQHAPDVKHKEIRETIIEEIIKKTVPIHLLDKKTEFLINPTGKFVVGGPEGDAGVTGRKIIVDTYGGMGRHGGGAFSGKDPSKVDRSAAYMGRYVAKNIVAAGLADRCEIQFAYAIGHPEPVSVSVDTFGTGKTSQESIEKAVVETFSFKPANIIKQLDLLRPIYSQTTNYGHFGKTHDTGIFTWERTDKAEALKKAAR